jgi:catechol 2,3-dioxygenase-like lactoylglutathione lyase family enzyme
MNVDLVTLVVRDYDSAIEFFTKKLGFELVEDSPAKTRSGQPKRWVVVRPPGAETALLLARADGQRDEQAVGSQAGGRVAFFLRVSDFDATYDRMKSVGVPFLEAPRVEPYGQVAVFLDCAGNRWDLRGPN